MKITSRSAKTLPALAVACGSGFFLAASAAAYQPWSTGPRAIRHVSTPVGDVARSNSANGVTAVGSAAAVFALSTMLLLGEPNAALAASIAAPETATTTSTTAAQVSLNSLPPASISVEIKDLPVVGNLLSGTYTKVKDGSVANPSITIKSPKDKVKAIKELTGGHLEFDVNGVLTTHLDVDVAADQAGVAKIRVASNLIPPLPFKNPASGFSAGADAIKKGGKESPWNIVTNMGSGGKRSIWYCRREALNQRI